MLRRQGRTHIGAFVLGNDWKDEYQSDPSLIANMVVEDIKEGDIIALHDGDDRVTDAAKAYRGGTVKAVELILSKLEQMKLKAVTVEELLRSSDDGPYRRSEQDAAPKH